MQSRLAQDSLNMQIVPLQGRFCAFSADLPRMRSKILLIRGVARGDDAAFQNIALLVEGLEKMAQPVQVR